MGLPHRPVFSATGGALRHHLGAAGRAGFCIEGLLGGTPSVALRAAPADRVPGYLMPTTIDSGPARCLT